MTKFRYQTLLLEKITIKTLYILIILKNNFILLKTFLFPLMHFEDRLYVKKYFVYNNFN